MGRENQLEAGRGAEEDDDDDEVPVTPGVEADMRQIDDVLSSFGDSLSHSETPPLLPSCQTPKRANAKTCKKRGLGVRMAGRGLSLCDVTNLSTAAYHAPFSRDKSRPSDAQVHHLDYKEPSLGKKLRRGDKFTDLSSPIFKQSARRSVQSSRKSSGSDARPRNQTRQQTEPEPSVVRAGASKEPRRNNTSEASRPDSRQQQQPRRKVVQPRPATPDPPAAAAWKPEKGRKAERAPLKKPWDNPKTRARSKSRDRSATRPAKGGAAAPPQVNTVNDGSQSRVLQKNLSWYRFPDTLSFKPGNQKRQFSVHCIQPSGEHV